MSKTPFKREPRTLEECGKSFEALHQNHEKPVGATTVALFEQRFKGNLQGFAIAETKKED